MGADQAHLNHLGHLSKIHSQSLLPTTVSSARISKDGARAQRFGEHDSGICIFDVLPFLAPSGPHHVGVTHGCWIPLLCTTLKRESPEVGHPGPATASRRESPMSREALTQGWLCDRVTKIASTFLRGMGLALCWIIQEPPSQRGFP